MKELECIDAFETWINQEKRNPHVAIQELDLRPYKEIILNQQFPRTLFLGCKMDTITAGHIVSTGGWVIPQKEGLLFKTHRSWLYTPEELFEGFIPGARGYEMTLDHRIYREYLVQGKDHPESIEISLMRRLHDHSITDTLEELIEGKKIVAVMGGHSMERRDPFYEEIAVISRMLTREGFTMVTGGGPGAMEAAHLGAYFAPLEDEKLDEALEILKPRPQGALPGKEYADIDWLERAMKVVERFPLDDAIKLENCSIGIPTWLYGHEPPTVFPTRIAKYFANSVREEGLLAIAKHGVIFSPGSAGTVQEIFQDACQNHYAPSHHGPGKRFVSPMILLGETYWTQEKPVWPLLKDLAKDQPYGKLLSISDSREWIVNQISSYDPLEFSFPKK